VAIVADTAGANQPPPLAGHDLFGQNRPLVEALEREGAAWAEERCAAFAAALGGEAAEWGRLANENPPRLRTHDRFGERIDEVEFHPSWHELLRLSVAHGVHALSWTEPRPHSRPGADVLAGGASRQGAQVARAVLFYLASQVEAGHGCPVSMTHAAVPALRAAAPDLAAAWEPLLTSREYDFGLRSAAEKRAALCGMAMTERQGGSDVRANTTAARPAGGGEYELDGAKWFCSAPMSDVFLVLAQAPRPGSTGGGAAGARRQTAAASGDRPGGLSCFLVPRVLPDGSRNGFRIDRLKDKLGDRSNASGEIRLESARAQLVGEEGRGVRTIVEMVVHTRLDCVLGAAAGMRQAVEQATHHAAHRVAFGRTLAEAPLMRNVLADLCLESEAATVTALRLARAYDRRAAGDEQEAAFARIATAVAKYWVCKRGPGHAAEALECVGGNGYVEESVLPRLYRQQPLLSIWEGSGNVVCLDVLRAVQRDPETAAALLAEVRLADHPAATALAERALAELDEPGARSAVERLALALQASLLVRHSPPAVADAFCAARLGAGQLVGYGTLRPGPELDAIVDRHRPVTPTG
jgi:putative acyl-CoA dehydrogenase